MTHRCLPLLLFALAAAAHAQTFQLVVTETPPGSGHQQQPVLRYLVNGSGGAVTRLADVPRTQTSDPACPAFRSPLELFVGNRHGNQGPGSVSPFVLGSNAATAVPGPRLTGNALSGVHQIAFDPAGDELFCANQLGGAVSRFRFDALGAAIANGTVAMPDTLSDRGIAIRAADRQLFVSALTLIRRFRRNLDGSYTHLGNFTTGTSSLHFLKFRGDELYAADYGAGVVHRFRFDANGAPVPNGGVTSPNAIDVAFSPDGAEMYVSSHGSGGIRRFTYNSGNDSWTPGATIAAPSLGGIAVSPLDASGSFDPYGNGCPGTGGRVPSLSAIGSAARGRALTLNVFDGPGGAAGALFASVSTGNLPLPGGCTLLLGFPLVQVGVLPLDPAGSARVGTTVPVTITPADVLFQFAALDAGSGNGVFTLTNGLRVRVQ
jgi:hypothetical protein